RALRGDGRRSVVPTGEAPGAARLRPDRGARLPLPRLLRPRRPRDPPAHRDLRPRVRRALLRLQQPVAGGGTPPPRERAPADREARARGVLPPPPRGARARARVRARGARPRLAADVPATGAGAWQLRRLGRLLPGRAL